MDIGINSSEDLEQLARARYCGEVVGTLIDRLPYDPSNLRNPETELGTDLLRLPDPPVDPVLTIYAALRASRGSLYEIADLLNPARKSTPPVLQSLLRVALLSSARVAYMTIPSAQEERIENIKRVMASEAKSLTKAYEASSRFTQLQGLKPPEEIVRAQAIRRASIDAKPITETDLVCAVADIVERENPNPDPELKGVLKEQYLWLFNHLSGVSHGYGWTRLVPGTTSMSGHFVSDYLSVASLAHLAADTAVRRATTK